MLKKFFAKWDYKTCVLPAATVGLLTLTLLFLSGNLLIVSLESQRLYVVVACVILMVLNIGKVREITPLGKYAGLAAGVLLLSGFFRLYDYYHLLIFFSLVVWCFYWFCPGEFQRRCCLAVLFYSLFWMAYQTNYLVFNAVDWLSVAFSQNVSLLFSAQSHVLGPSASGFLVLLPFVFFFLLAYRKDWRSSLLFAVGIILVWGLYQASSQVLLSAFAQVTAQVLLVPLAVLLLVFLPAYGDETPGTDSGKKLGDWSAKGWAIGVSVALLFLIYQGFYFERQPKPGKRVLFSENGFFDLKTPNFKEFGSLKGGLFGLLPKHLQVYGYSCTSYKGDVSAASLSQTDVLVITNPQKPWGQGELRLIWDFIKNGGSLLVLGDHTDIMGTQNVLNALLEPVNIRFNFDSGFPCRMEWRYCLENRPHPINTFVRGFQDTTISVGATLAVAAPSYPVIIGKFGFADYGNRANVQGAFLGDYSYQPGEKLGDVALVAASRYGKGKVLVFGDTSPFQNGALAGSFPRFVYQIFEWLVAADGGMCNPWLCLSGWFLLCVCFYFLSGRAGRWEILAIILVMGLGFWVAQGKTQGNYQFKPREEPIFWVDTSHNERLAFYPFQRNSVSGIFQNAVRNGYFTYIMEEFGREDLKQGKVFLSVAPTRAFSEEERGILDEFMQRGGAVILAAGYEDRAGCESLLKSFNLDIADVPLGPVPIIKTKESSSKDVQFVSAWPIVDISGGKRRNLFKVRMAEDALVVVDGKQVLKAGAQREYVPVRNDLEVIYQHKGFALVIAKKVGRGTLIFVADSLFLGEENLESLSYYKEGNIFFLKNLFDRLRAMPI